MVNGLALTTILCPVIEIAERSKNNAKLCSGVIGARPKAESPGTKPHDFALSSLRSAVSITGHKIVV